MNTSIRTENSELLQLLHENGRTKTFHSGKEVFGVGEKAEFLPMILQGRVKVVRFLEEGKEIILNFFNDGDVFAIPPILDGRNYPATAIAMEDTKILLVYKTEFFKLLDESDEFSDFIMSRMSSLMREIASSMENLAVASPEKRIGKILIKISEKESQNGTAKINLRRQDIAEMAGLTTETTIRTVKKLADKNLIKIVLGKIYVEDKERLIAYLQ